MCAEGLRVIHKNNVRMQPPAYITMGQIKLAPMIFPGKKYFEMALAIASETKDLTSKMEAHYQLWKA